MSKHVIIALVLGLLMGWGCPKIMEAIEKTTVGPDPVPTQAEKANQLLRERCPQTLKSCPWLNDTVFSETYPFEYRAENPAQFSMTAGFSRIIEGLDSMDLYFPDFSARYLHHFNDKEGLEKIKYVQSCISNIRGWTDLLNDQLIYLKSDLKNSYAFDYAIIGYDGDFLDEDFEYVVTYNIDFTKILNIEKIKIVGYDGIREPYNQYLIRQREIKKFKYD